MLGACSTASVPVVVNIVCHVYIPITVSIERCGAESNSVPQRKKGANLRSRELVDVVVVDAAAVAVAINAAAATYQIARCAGYTIEAVVYK